MASQAAHSLHRPPSSPQAPPIDRQTARSDLPTPPAADGEGPDRRHPLVVAVLSNTKKGPATVARRSQPPREKGGGGWSPATTFLASPSGCAEGSSGGGAARVRVERGARGLGL
jgi:hypothetical protein